MSRLRDLYKCGVFSGRDSGYYDFDFSVLSSIPADLINAGNWSIVDSKAVNNPTPTDEILTDPGLETWVSATNLTNWEEVLQGTTSINQDGTTKHAGSYSARFDVDAGANNSFIRTTLAGLAGSPFVLMSYWAKASAGTPNVRYALAGAAYRALNTDWQQFRSSVLYYAVAANFVSFHNSTGSGGLSIHVDDLSLKRVSAVNAIAVRRCKKARSCVQVVGQHGGVDLGYYVINSLDNPSDPKNYLIAQVKNATISLHKFVNNAGSQIINDTAITYVAGAPTEILWVDTTTVELRYNGQRIGNPVTVSDAGIVDNLYAGFASVVADTTISRLTIYPSYSTDSIFCIGDSTTSLGGSDEINTNGWPLALQDLYTDARLVEQPARYAVGGYTVATSKAGIDAALAAAVGTPTKIMIYLGANDVASMPVEATYKTNMNYILDALHTKWANAQIWVGTGGRTGSEANTATLTTWNATCMEGRDYCHVGVNYTNIFSGNEATLLADSVHPNHAGYVAAASHPTYGWKVLIDA